jgi:hypothetical protein
MGGMPEPPRGWDPKTDSLEDLVHAMFQDNPTEAQRSATSDAPPSPAADPRERPSPAAGKRPAGLLSGRGAAPLLAVAALVTAGLAGGQILTATTATGPVAAAPTAAPSTTVSLPTTAAATPQPAAAPPPVALDFGKRSALPDGWSLASSRPYLCDVLMAIPVLQKDGTRIMRVTLTLTNRTGAPQATRQWRLAATADGAPAEFVLWPAERFRGVPDTTLNAGRSVRFLVAFRVPEHPVQVRISAERDAAPGAVLAGSL